MLGKELTSFPYMPVASCTSSIPTVKALHFGGGISSLKWRKEKGVHQKGTATYKGKPSDSISKPHAAGTCSSRIKNSTVSVFAFTFVNELMPYQIPKKVQKQPVFRGRCFFLRFRFCSRVGKD